MGGRRLTGLRTAAAFLTRLPVAPRLGTADLGRGLPWFPLVGAFVGLVAAGAYLGMRVLAGRVLAAVTGVAVAILVTGALHEDGLADLADALGARDRAHALEVLRDPVHGTFGVLALVLSVVARVSAVATLRGASAVAVLVGAHALSRAAAASLLLGPAARSDGLGASYARSATPFQVGAAVLIGALVAGGAMGVWGLAGAGLAAVAAVAGVRVARRVLGGTTGDVLGAVQQGAEILVLVLGAVLVGRGWSLPGW